MNELRKMILYFYGTKGKANVAATVKYQFTTLATERQIADDIAKIFGFRQGEGFISIIDEDEIGINKLEYQP